MGGGTGRLLERDVCLDETFAGTGRLPRRDIYRTGHLLERDVCLDGTLNGISPCTYNISLIFNTFRLYGKNFCHDVFRRVPEKRDPGSLNWDPGKTGQFVLCKHSVPLCREDILC